MKEYTIDELRQKAERYCVIAERCFSDVRQKLQQWGGTPEVIDEVLVLLQKEHYIDEHRNSKALVRDKYRFNKWGRVKISQMLSCKNIPQENIDAALAEIDEQAYLDGLRVLLSAKSRSVTARDSYDFRVKLIRFAVGKGYTIDEIKRCMENEDADEFP